MKTRTGNGQVHEGELINVDVTSAGATMALGLTYFNTKSTTICDWLQLPQSQYLLESVRPDLLQLRVSGILSAIDTKRFFELSITL